MVISCSFSSSLSLTLSYVHCVCELLFCVLFACFGIRLQRVKSIYMNVLLVHSKWCFYANVLSIGFSISLWSRTHQEPHSNKYIIVCFCSTSSSPQFYFSTLFVLLAVHNNLHSYLGCMLLLKYSRILWFYSKTYTYRAEKKHHSKWRREKYTGKKGTINVFFSSGVFSLRRIKVYMWIYAPAGLIVWLLSFIASNSLWPALHPVDFKACRA